MEDLWNLFEKQERKCAMTGLGLTLRGYGKPPGTASVDRIDSSKGYTKDNIQWVHKDVNKMKMDFTKEYFIEVCRLITEKH